MPQKAGFLLKPNDRIVFLGDSITEQHLYTNYVQSYLLGRFPEMKLEFFNAGWGGDTAPGGLARLDRDVLALEPTVVTICYGMNDGAYMLPSEAIRTRFVEGMTGLIGRLKSQGIRIALLTPGFGEEAPNPNLKAVQYNSKGLRVLADAVLALARKHHLPVFDIHKLMNEVYARGAAAQPGFSLAPDGFHPGEPGHLVMAFGLLKALGVPERREAIAANVRSRKASSAQVGQASCLPAGGTPAPLVIRQRDGYRLDLSLDSIPFYVDPPARKALPYLPFQETFNSVRLAVEGLDGGRYHVRLNGAPLGQWPAKRLADGIDIAELWTSEPLLKAQTLHTLVAEECAIYHKLWRTFGFQGTAYYAPAHRAGAQLAGRLAEARRRTLAAMPARHRIQLSLRDLADAVDDGDFIRRWRMFGPFPRPYSRDYLDGEARFSALTPPEGFTPSGGYSGTSSSARTTGPQAGEFDPECWTLKEVNLANLGNCLCELYGPVTNCFVYACAALESPVEQSADLLVGSDDGVAVYFNGQPLLRNLDVTRGLTVDQERMKVRLRAGRNVLLLKITQGGGNWGFSARFDGLREPVSVR